MKTTGVTVDDLYLLIRNPEDEELKKILDSLDEVFVEGWIRTNRDNGSIGFIALNDGTCFKNVQLVYDENTLNYKELAHLNTGASISVIGNFVLTPNAKQPFEIHVKEFELEGDVASDYPLQKKAHSLEFLRDIAHLRPRANTFNAVFRMRNAMAMAIHEFFQERGFMYVHTPIITGNDAEGAGSTFGVITGDKEPFFGKPVSLTVSGQLHVEAFALAFRDVYTFGPTFRAEHSNTTRHASEFWMIEPEICFADLFDDIECAENYLKFCLKYVLENNKDDLEFLEKNVEKGLQERLKNVVENEFKRLSYTEAIDLLKNAVEKNKKLFIEKKELTKEEKEQLAKEKKEKAEAKKKAKAAKKAAKENKEEEEKKEEQ